MPTVARGIVLGLQLQLGLILRLIDLSGASIQKGGSEPYHGKF